MYLSPIDRELNEYKHAATLLLIMGGLGFLILAFMIYVIGSERESHSIREYAGAMSTLLVTVPITGVGLYHALKFRMLKRLRWNFGDISGIGDIGEVGESSSSGHPVRPAAVEETAQPRGVQAISERPADFKASLCPCIADLPARGTPVASRGRPSNPQLARSRAGRYGAGRGPAHAAAR